MADDYNGRCAMCKHFNLYDKYRFCSDKYKCTLKDNYYPWSDRACSKFEQANRSFETVDKAREGRL